MKIFCFCIMVLAFLQGSVQAQSGPAETKLGEKFLLLQDSQPNRGMTSSRIIRHPPSDSCVTPAIRRKSVTSR
jgi:hypothetical protein